MTAAATTGPASGPLPASSQPATGHTPRLSAARSRRKVGRMSSSPSGRRTTRAPAALLPRRAAARPLAPPPLVCRLIARWCARRVPSQPVPAHPCGARGNRSADAQATAGAVLEQAELLGAVLRRAEMIGGEPRAGLVEAKLVAGELEAATDHPGDRAAAGHALAPGRIVVLAAAGLADELEDVPIGVGKIRHQPFAE